jgi:hypothetical protein
MTATFMLVSPSYTGPNVERVLKRHGDGSRYFFR